jgi:hypothetical protein
VLAAALTTKAMTSVRFASNAATAAGTSSAAPNHRRMTPMR